MNEFGGRVDPVVGGYRAYVRLPSDADAKPILAKGGKAKLYTSEAEAERAVRESICRYVNGHLVRDGETLRDGTLAKANAVFPTLIKQRGREQRIVVERKGGRR